MDDRGNESFVTNIIIAIYSELAQEEKRILSERIKSGMANGNSRHPRITHRINLPDFLKR
jgi:DNA invertase Pin-like site-specific DNA recombinase